MADLDPRTIGANIRMYRPSLTSLELKVVDNILAMQDFDEKTSIKEIALKNDVSEATLVKIARKLNFSGFKELKNNLAKYKREKISHEYNEISCDDSIDQLIDKVFKNSIIAIKETLSIIDKDDIIKSVDMLLNAKEILLLGIGGSAQIAHDFSHKLLKIGVRTFVYSDSHLMLMAASVCTKDSVALAVSHSGCTKDVIEALKTIKDIGAKTPFEFTGLAETIVLTNYATSPITQYADVILRSTSQGSSLLNENAAARLAQLNILDVIYVAYVQRRLKESEQNLVKTQKVVTNKRVKW